MMAAAAIESINIMEESSDKVQSLQRNTRTLRQLLNKWVCSMPIMYDMLP